MDASTFAQGAESWAAVHRRFAPLFGRPEAQERSEQYRRGRLVQHAARRNADNRAEAGGGVSPRARQRLLTAAPWSTERGRARRPAVVAARLNAPAGACVRDDTGFAKQGTRSVGVARPYSGTLGTVGNCPVGVFLGYASARGPALVAAALFLPRAWTAAPARWAAAGGPADVTDQTTPAWGRALLRQARAPGALQSRWVTADAGDGAGPRFRAALEADGWGSGREVPRTTRVVPTRAPTAVPPWSGRGRQPPRARRVAGAPPAPGGAARAAALPAPAWPTRTGAEGAQGPRTDQVAAQRGWARRAGLPGRPPWGVWRRHLAGSERKQYLSQAPADPPLGTLGRGGALRGPIATGCEQAQGAAGRDAEAVRRWPGGHQQGCLARLARAVRLPVRQDWGDNRPAGVDRAPRKPGAARVPAPPARDAGRPPRLAARDTAPHCRRQAGAPAPPAA